LEKYAEDVAVMQFERYAEDVAVMQFERYAEGVGEPQPRVRTE
jgi:hypothetical protein